MNEIFEGYTSGAIYHLSLGTASKPGGLTGQTIHWLHFRPLRRERKVSVGEVKEGSGGTTMVKKIPLVLILSTFWFRDEGLLVCDSYLCNKIFKKSGSEMFQNIVLYRA